MRPTRILVRYQACNVTYELKCFFHVFVALLVSWILKPVLWWVGQLQSHGGNVRVIGQCDKILAGILHSLQYTMLLKCTQNKVRKRWNGGKKSGRALCVCVQSRKMGWWVGATALLPCDAAARRGGGDRGSLKPRTSAFISSHRCIIVQ